MDQLGKAIAEISSNLLLAKAEKTIQFYLELLESMRTTAAPIVVYRRGRQAYIRFEKCPFKPGDSNSGAASIVVDASNEVRFECKHAKTCSEHTLEDFAKLLDREDLPGLKQTEEQAISMTSKVSAEVLKQIAFLYDHNRDQHYLFFDGHWVVASTKLVQAVTYPLIEDILEGLSSGKPIPFAAVNLRLFHANLDRATVVSLDSRPSQWWYGDAPPLAHWDDAMNVTVVKNGWFNQVAFFHDEVAFIEDRTPALFGSKCSNVSYDPTASRMPVFDQYLKNLHFDEHNLRHLQEMCGYLFAFCPKTNLQTIIVHEGTAGSGKSALTSLMLKMLGQYAISRSAEQFSGSVFSLGDKVGKKVVLYPELNDLTSAKVIGKVMSYAKMDSGGDTQTVNVKGSDFVELRDPPVPMIAANRVLSAIKDNSKSMMRRLVPLLWHRKIPREEIIENLDTLLVEESSAIFNWVLQGAKRLYHRKHFDLPLTSQHMIEAFSQTTTCYGAFAEDCLSTSPGQHLCEASCYALYAKWSESVEQLPDLKSEFSKEITSAVEGSQRSRPKNQREHQRLPGIKKSKRPWLLLNVQVSETGMELWRT